MTGISRCPCGKRAYPTAAQAEDAAAAVHAAGTCRCGGRSWRAHRCTTDGRSWRAHRCTIDGVWHWGHNKARLGVPWRSAQLLRITARVPHGAVLDPAWPAPLDGILAAALHRERLGGAYGEVGTSRAENLPLCHSRLPGADVGRPQCGYQWIWAASCAVPSTDATDVRQFHQRYDDLAGELVVDKVPASTDTGRFKPWQIPLVVTLGPVLTWWAVGDPDALLAACQRVEQIGKKRGHGEGITTGWAVEPVGPAEWDRVLWRPDGRIARPVPARAAASVGVPDADTTPAAYRPPYWRGRHVTDNGQQARQMQEVIAPWTMRPSSAQRSA